MYDLNDVVVDIGISAQSIRSCLDTRVSRELLVCREHESRRASRNRESAERKKSNRVYLVFVDI